MGYHLLNWGPKEDACELQSFRPVCCETVEIVPSLTTRWIAGLGVAAALVATVTNAGAQNACEVVKRADAVTHHRHRGIPPLVVGDSTLLLAAPALGRLGLQADARGCRQFTAGVELLRARRRAHTLPRVTVLALGANGPISDGGMSAALSTVGRRRVLALVTAKRSPASTSRMHAAAREHPDRVLLIDWVAYSSRHGSWFAGDGLHVSNTGASAYAHFIRRALRPFLDQPVAALALPRHRADAHRCAAVHPHGLAIGVYIARGSHRISCLLARRLVRRPVLRRIPDWRFYDWTTTHNGPWSRVYVRRDRRVVVAAITHGEL
jgi:hypothetical protein